MSVMRSTSRSRRSRKMMPSEEVDVKIAVSAVKGTVAIRAVLGLSSLIEASTHVLPSARRKALDTWKQTNKLYNTIRICAAHACAREEARWTSDHNNGTMHATTSFSEHLSSLCVFSTSFFTFTFCFTIQVHCFHRLPDDMTRSMASAHHGPISTL